MIPKRVLTGVLFLIAAAVSGAACYSSREEVRQLEDVSGFVFTGNLDGASLSVKQGDRPVWDKIEIDPEERYLIQPGTYEIVVEREGKVVVHRKLLLSSGNFAEIRVP